MRRQRLYGETRVTARDVKGMVALFVLPVFVFVLVAAGIAKLVNALFGSVTRRVERAALLDQVQRHLRELSAKHAALESRNGYGAVHPKEWAREVNRFLSTRKVQLTKLSSEEAHALVTAAVESERMHGSSATVEVAWRAALSHPLAFEQKCAAELEALGWQAKLTPRSGDQGIDVIAKRSTFVAVIQCKLYSQPVDLSAVQQVLGGKAYSGAHLAAVVSNAGFTRAAHDLAARADVLLLHYSELARLGGAREQGAAQAFPDRALVVCPSAELKPARGVLGNFVRALKAH